VDSPYDIKWKNASDRDSEATEPYGSASLGPKPEARRTYEKALTRSGKWKLGRISSQIVQTGSKQVGVQEPPQMYPEGGEWKTKRAWRGGRTT
jgi:hypothetical protein